MFTIESKKGALHFFKTTMDNIGMLFVFYLLLIVIRAASGIGYEFSSTKVTWKEAHSRCLKFGQSFRNISYNKGFVTLRRTKKMELSSDLKQPEVYWIGGYEILTHWITSIGCYPDTQHKDSIVKETTFEDSNQAIRCAMFCEGDSIYYTLKLEKCQCRRTLKSYNSRTKRCNGECPGNIMEKCGDEYTHIVYKKSFKTTKNKAGMCMSSIMKNDEWKPKSRNCSDELKYLYKDSNKNLCGSNRTFDWFGAREQTDLTGTLFSHDSKNLNKNQMKNIVENEEYWTSIFRNRSIVWNDENLESSSKDKTGRCVALYERQNDDWIMDYRDCDEKFLYMCESENIHDSHIVSLENDPSNNEEKIPAPRNPFTEKTTLSERTTQSSETNVFTTMTDMADIEEQILMEDIYKYVVVGVGSALVVCFVFGCVLIVKRCLRKKPSENKGEVTSTTELSVGNENHYACSNIKAKPEEHIYEEIADPPLCDIRINNYSEPLPLKDAHVQNNFRMEYAEPYDSLKNRNGKLNVKMLNKNDRSNLTKQSNIGVPSKGEPHYSEFNIATISNGLLKFAQKDIDAISNGTLSEVDVKHEKDKIDPHASLYT